MKKSNLTGLFFASVSVCLLTACGSVKAPLSSENVVHMKRGEVEEDFRDAGFENINFKAIELALADESQGNSEVKQVEIDGVHEFYDAPVAARPVQQPTPSTQRKFKQIANCPVLERTNSIELRDLCNTFEVFRHEGVIVIENLQGKMLYSYPLSRTLNISRVPKGMYVVKFINKKKKKGTHRLCFLKKV
jgi:hypothetical protein